MIDFDTGKKSIGDDIEQTGQEVQDLLRMLKETELNEPQIKDYNHTGEELNNSQEDKDEFDRMEFIYNTGFKQEYKQQDDDE